MIFFEVHPTLTFNEWMFSLCDLEISTSCSALPGVHMTAVAAALTDTVPPQSGKKNRKWRLGLMPLPF